MLKRGLIIAAAVAGLATPALAVESITYAQFNQTNLVKAAGVSTTGGVTTLTISPVSVDFTVLDFGPLGEYGLTLSGSASTSNAAVTVGSIVQQDGYNGSFVFTDGTSNYLTVAFTNAAIVGFTSGAASGSFFGAIPTSGITVSSDILDVSGLSLHNFALSFSAVSPAFKIQNGHSFTANLTGTFAAAVPEPATWAMLIAGFGMVGVSMRRRRTMATAA